MNEPLDQPTAIGVLAIRELSEQEARDFSASSDYKGTGAAAIQYRQRAMAQLMARGLNDKVIAAALNCSPLSVRNARSRPHVRELVEAFQTEAIAEFMEPRTRIRDTMLLSLELLNKKLEDEALVQLMSPAALVDVFQKTADRCGYAPVAKSVAVSGKLSRSEIEEILKEVES